MAVESSLPSHLRQCKWCKIVLQGFSIRFMTFLCALSSTQTIFKSYNNSDAHSCMQFHAEFNFAYKTQWSCYFSDCFLFFALESVFRLSQIIFYTRTEMKSLRFRFKSIAHFVVCVLQSHADRKRGREREKRYNGR